MKTDQTMDQNNKNLGHTEAVFEESTGIAVKLDTSKNTARRKTEILE